LLSDCSPRQPIWSRCRDFSYGKGISKQGLFEAINQTRVFDDALQAAAVMTDLPFFWVLLAHAS
jgi:hypothetical protein